MEECEGLLTGDILFDCDNPPVGGIEVNVLLANKSDVDYATTTFDPANKTICTNLQLLPEKTGYYIQGVKQVQKGSSELVIKESGPNKHKHTFAGVALNFSRENKLQLQSMSEGGSFIAVLELKWKGVDNKDAYQILGLKSGLEMSVMTWSTAENDGTVLFELSSPDGYEEPTLPHTLLETSYALTRTAFGNKFAQAAI